MVLLFLVVSIGSLASYIVFIHEEEDSNSGNLNLFCRIQATELPEASSAEEEKYYSDLLEVAPPDIRAIVVQLKNYSRSFEEIKQTGSIEELFNKAFGGQALEEAEQELLGYANTWCV